MNKDLKNWKGPFTKAVLDSVFIKILHGRACLMTNEKMFISIINTHGYIFLEIVYYDYNWWFQTIEIFCYSFHTGF